MPAHDPSQTHGDGVKRIADGAVLRRINKYGALVVWAASCIAMASKSTPVYGFLFFVPFSLFPHAVTHAMAFMVHSKPAQAVLLMTQVGYAAWFFYAYLMAFYIAIDPQSPIALVFVGIYALPVLLLFWVCAIMAERQARAEQQAGPPAGEIGESID